MEMNEKGFWKNFLNPERMINEKKLRVFSKGRLVGVILTGFLGFAALIFGSIYLLHGSGEMKNGRDFLADYSSSSSSEKAQKKLESILFAPSSGEKVRQILEMEKAKEKRVKAKKKARSRKRSLSSKSLIKGMLSKGDFLPLQILNERVIRTNIYQPGQDQFRSSQGMGSGEQELVAILVTDFVKNDRVLIEKGSFFLGHLKGVFKGARGYRANVQWSLFRKNKNSPSFRFRARSLGPDGNGGLPVDLIENTSNRYAAKTGRGAMRGLMQGLGAALSVTGIGGAVAGGAISGMGESSREAANGVVKEANTAIIKIKRAQPFVASVEMSSQKIRNRNWNGGFAR